LQGDAGRGDFATGLNVHSVSQIRCGRCLEAGNDETSTAERSVERSIGVEARDSEARAAAGVGGATGDNDFAIGLKAHRVPLSSAAGADWDRDFSPVAEGGIE